MPGYSDSIHFATADSLRGTERSMELWFEPDLPHESRIVTEDQQGGLQRAEPGDVLAPDLDSEHRDLGWCCPSCGGEMIAKLRDWPCSVTIEGKTVECPRPRWRLYCGGQCLPLIHGPKGSIHVGTSPMDYSAGSVRSSWMIRHLSGSVADRLRRPPFEDAHRRVADRARELTCKDARASDDRPSPLKPA